MQNPNSSKTPENVFMNEYFNWLYDWMDEGLYYEPDKKYFILFKKLHRKTFYWTVPNDDNRGADGQRLRDRFSENIGWFLLGSLDSPCSMLEMLVALAVRCNNIMMSPGEHDATYSWFWEILENIHLDNFSDDKWFQLDGDIVVDQILNRVLDRQYSRKGIGGLFPLKNTIHDQRKVEIWYQMSEYLIEKNKNF